MPRTLTRAPRAILYTVATFVILWFALIETPMWLTRLHAQHLLADFQSIQVNQSDWSDAQRLMQRWGRWGHYDGTCTPTSCAYNITIEDAPSKWIYFAIEHEWVNPLGKFGPIFNFLQHIGWHSTIFSVSFAVHNGKIVRTATFFILGVPPPLKRGFIDVGYVLHVRSQLRPHLREQPMDEHQPWILGDDVQLDDHPDYKTGRPSGCTGCISSELTYTPTLPHAEVVHLTSLNLSCITRLPACRELEDILPAAVDWQLHRFDSEAPIPASPPIPCRMEPRARARDAAFVLEVDALSKRTVELHDYDVPQHAEFDRVRILQILKGEHRDQVGDAINFIPFSGMVFVGNIEPAENLDHGKRYFIFLDSDMHVQTWNNLEASRCGVLESTPANLAQIKLGIAQDTPEPPSF